MSEIEVFRDESPTDSSDPPAAVQSTSDPQDNSTEPVAAIRGRQPSRTTAANASKRRSPPSPSPPRQQPPSPASSHAPSAEKLDRGRNPSSSHQRRRHYPTTFKQVRSPRPLQFSPVRGISKFLPSTRISDHSKQEPQITLLAARPNLHSLKDRPPNRSSRPSASLGRAPDTAALSPHLPRASTERQLATQPSKESAFASTSRLTRTSTPPSAAYSYTQPRTTNPSPTHGPQLRHSRPALLHQRKPRRPFTPPPPLSPSTKLFQAQTYPNHRPKHQPFPPLFHAVSSVPGAPFSLSTTSPLPIPPNALALEPPPVANSIRSIRSQILSEIQNIGTGGGSTPHPSTSLFRTNIPLKPSLETSPRSLPQFNSPSSLPKDPPVIPDSMEKLQNFSLHL